MSTRSEPWSGRNGLGCSKDVEKLLRKVRRAGYDVHISGSTHVEVRHPETGHVAVRTALTGNTRSERNDCRALRRLLSEAAPARP